MYGQYEKLDIVEDNLCTVSADMFALAAEKGYDMEDFAKRLFNSEYGDGIYSEYGDWTSGGYMLEGVEREFDLKKGGNYGYDDLWLVGFLYPYWAITRGLKISEVYEKVNVVELVERSLELDDLGCEYFVRLLEGTWDYGDM